MTENKTADPREERRQAAIETCEFLEHQITALQLDQSTFRRFADAVSRSATVSQTHFPQSVATWYAQSVLVRLRAIGDNDRRAHSLRRLLDRMIANPADWGVETIVDLYSLGEHPYSADQVRFLATSTFRNFAQSGSTSLDVQRLERDRDALDAAIGSVKEIVDRTIAHNDRRGSTVTMTYDDLRAAIDKVEEIAKPYISLLTGRSYIQMTPVDQYDWWRIFDPWVDGGSGSGLLD
jgi:hypothetical protein